MKLITHIKDKLNDVDNINVKIENLDVGDIIFSKDDEILMIIGEKRYQILHLVLQTVCIKNNHIV